MGEITYALIHPIVLVEFGVPPRTTTITELKLAPRVKGKHLLATDGAVGAVDHKLRLIAALSGISVDEAQELDEDDIDAIDDLYDERPSKAQLDLVVKLVGITPEKAAHLDRAGVRVLLNLFDGKLAVPLDAGAGPSPDGRSTGETSSAT